MGLFDSIAKLFGKKPPTLEQLSLDDLKRDMFTVQEEIEKLEVQNDKFEKDEYQLLEEYKAAHAAGHLSLKKSLYQKRQNVQMRRKGIDQRLTNSNKVYLTLTGLLNIKEDMEYYEKSKVGAIIKTMNIDDLGQYVLQATVEGKLMRDKFTEILGDINRTYSQDSGDLYDATNDGMAELDKELGLRNDSGQQETVKTPDLSDVMKTINAVAEMGADAARQMQQNVTPQQTSQNNTPQENEQ